jgi:hypothetical protein
MALYVRTKDKLEGIWKKMIDLIEVTAETWTRSLPYGADIKNSGAIPQLPIRFHDVELN